MSQPVSQFNAGVSNVDEFANVIFVFDNQLDIAPIKFVRA